MELNATDAADEPQYFLRQLVRIWKPEWFLQLATIAPDRNSKGKYGIKTRAARVDQLGTLGDFIDSNNGGLNLYYVVNPLSINPGTKAEEEHVAAACTLQVDIDPPKDAKPADLPMERARIRKKLANFRPPPSVIIDSGGGYQALWLLAEPVAREDAKRVNIALKTHFGCDNCQSTDHLMRLPGTKNLPNEEKRNRGRVPALARVVEMNESRYRLADFDFLSPADTQPGMPVEIDIGAVDEAALEARLAVARKSDPELDMLMRGESLPRQKDKTGSGDDIMQTQKLKQWGFSRNEAAFVLAKSEHGKKNKTADYIKRTVGKVYGAAGGAAARVSVVIRPGERNVQVDSALQLLRDDGGFFDHGGELVYVTGDGAIVPVGADRLQMYLDCHIAFQKFDARKNKWVAADCPDKLPKAILALHDEWQLPRLLGVIDAPILRLDGSMLDAEGYDERTGLYRYDGLELPISEGGPAAALGRLWAPFAEFPFDSPVARAVMLAAIFTAVLRPVLPTAPGFLIEAPTRGTGKTLIAKCISILAGVEPHISAMRTDEAEINKTLLAMLRRGAGVTIWDNVNGRLESDSLCAFLTSQHYEGRVLGQSEILRFDNRLLLLLTGNNVLLAGDLSRRVLSCRIDSGDERPDKRAFALEPLAYVRKHRAQMVADVLEILKAHRKDALVHAKRGVGRMASFEAWDERVREAVLYAGTLGVVELGDPFEAVDAASDNDPETAKLRALLIAWRNKFGNKFVTVAEATLRAGLDAPVLRAALDEVAGEGHVINPRRLGRWIESHRGRPIDGMKFEQGPVRHQAKSWRVVQ